ncbi:MAG TPA: hypothetical protein VG106_12225 [Vicinamibacterales bacterium]|nr:hypothetical protein [Vicinamibacterales bacterium]
MRILKGGALAALLVTGAAANAFATPNMIRLGYPTCASCHLSPQGGGVLTTYGKGIDAAQSLRPEEISETNLTESLRRLAYDMRFSIGFDRDPPAATGYGFNTSLRSAIGLSGHQKLVYAGSVASPTLTTARTSGAVTLRMSRLYWMYQPRQGLSFTVGRDDLPTGLGLPGATSYTRRVINPDVSSTPTQAKVFWWNHRWQMSAYGFGPDGNETSSRFKAYGAGAIIGADVWKNRAVIGATTRASYADAYDRRHIGAFLRLGLSKHWGVLLEHDLTARTTDKGDHLTHVSGHSQVFFVPFDWLQTALAGEHIRTIDGSYSMRLSPSAQVRLNRNVAVSFNTRDMFTGVASGRNRTYSLQVMLKTVE